MHKTSQREENSYSTNFFISESTKESFLQCNQNIIIFNYQKIHNLKVELNYQFADKNKNFILIYEKFQYTGIFFSQVHMLFFLVKYRHL